MQLKNVTCNYILIMCDTCNCIRQVVKNTFLLVIQVLKASQNKGEIWEMQSNEHEQLKK